eukprot:COSAG04_NODE_878_length_9680_cov_2.690951_9_plen_79_part_00
MRRQGNGGTHSTRERALSVAGSSAAASPSSSATVITGSSSGASCAQIAISISKGQVESDFEDQGAFGQIYFESQGGIW